MSLKLLKLVSSLLGYRIIPHLCDEDDVKIFHLHNGKVNYLFNNLLLLDKRYNFITLDVESVHQNNGSKQQLDKFTYFVAAVALTK